MPLIEANGLTKKFRQAVKEPGLVGSLKHFFTRQYRDKMAVDHIDLSVEAGESVAYLGPNGAGKSTTIKMLTGILVPTAGSLIVDGLVPHEKRQQNARKIGVVFGQRTQLWWDIPVVESFNLARDMYEIPPARYKENLAEFTELLGLEDFLNIPAGQDLARPADAGRPVHGPAPRPQAAVPRRADDRPGHRGQGQHPDVRAAAWWRNAGRRSCSRPTTWATSRTSAGAS